MKKLKMGILTAGGIAHMMAKTVQVMEEAEVVAVAARDGHRAAEFAATYKIPRSYGSYEALVEDPEVELVYVASPHSHHYEHARLCLEHGKHVLCEKAFTANAAQARALTALAREKGLFLMEAVWTRFLPLAETLKSLLEEERVIGNVRLVTADLGFPLSHVERMREPALAGGALLDLGIYPLTFASMVLGDRVVQASGTCVKTPLGVDEKNGILLTYESGALAVLHSCMTAQLDCRGVICGEKGFLTVGEINNWTEIVQYDLDRREVRRIPRPQQITGYEYEVLEARRQIAAGAVESPRMPHCESIRLMELMDSLREQWGIRFPFEQEENKK